MKFVQHTDVICFSPLLNPTRAVSVNNALLYLFYVESAGNDALLVFPELFRRFKACVGYLAVQRPTLLPAFLQFPGHTVVGYSDLHLPARAKLLPVFPLQLEPYAVVLFVQELRLHAAYAAPETGKLRVALNLVTTLLSKLLYDVPDSLRTDAQAGRLRDRMSRRPVGTLAD